MAIKLTFAAFMSKLAGGEAGGCCWTFWEMFSWFELISSSWLPWALLMISAEFVPVAGGVWLPNICDKFECCEAFIEFLSLCVGDNTLPSILFEPESNKFLTSFLELGDSCLSCESWKISLSKEFWCSKLIFKWLRFGRFCERLSDL